MRVAWRGEPQSGREAVIGKREGATGGIRTETDGIL